MPLGGWDPDGDDATTRRRGPTPRPHQTASLSSGESPMVASARAKVTTTEVTHVDDAPGLAPACRRHVRRRCANPTSGIPWTRCAASGSSVTACFASTPDSPLAAAAREGFAGVPYWPHDPALRFEADVEAVPREPVTALSLSGEAFRLERIGRVRLRIGDLEVYWIAVYGGGMFIPFRDATSGAGKNLRGGTLPGRHDQGCGPGRLGRPARAGLQLRVPPVVRLRPRGGAARSRRRRQPAGGARPRRGATVALCPGPDDAGARPASNDAARVG